MLLLLKLPPLALALPRQLLQPELLGVLRGPERLAPALGQAVGAGRAGGGGRSGGPLPGGPDLGRHGLGGRLLHRGLPGRGDAALHDVGGVVRGAGLGAAAPTASELLDSVGVAEGVQGVFAGARGGGDVCNHDGARVAGEGVAQHLRQLGSTEGHVPRVEVQRTDTFFQCQQTLVDLCTLQTSGPVVIGCICAALTPREVYEREFPPELAVGRLSLLAQVTCCDLLRPGPLPR
mmetsp:Transcript_22211/g.48764  ORF Transcript_22211/g.48764 Transcript_22211/m.48764 type:complete len:234 (+) Transcript_22211:734-1435(+)